MRPADPDDVMSDHGFPAALLPRPVVSSLFDPTTGDFEVRLPARVVRDVGGYRVRYDPCISGRIAPDEITSLKGVKARRGLWFPVSRIEAQGAALAFSVGPVVKHVPVDALT